MNPPRPAQARAGAFSGDVLERLGTPSPAEAAAATLLATLEPGLAKLYPADLDAFGLGARDRITQKTGHPARSLADRIAHILGLGEYDLYLHRARNQGISVESGSAPALLFPASIAELPETQQVFLLARPLCHIARRFHPMEKLTPRELEVLLASAARTVQPGYGTGLTSEDFLGEQQKRIQKALSRRQRKAMEEAAREYVAAGRVDFPRWFRHARRTANRIAALLADDLVACVQVLQRTERELGNLDGPALVRSSDIVADLLRFWVSDAALHLRRHAGMLES